MLRITTKFFAIFVLISCNNQQNERRQRFVSDQGMNCKLILSELSIEDNGIEECIAEGWSKYDHDITKREFSVIYDKGDTTLQLIVVVVTMWIEMKIIRKVSFYEGEQKILYSENSFDREFGFSMEIDKSKRDTIFHYGKKDFGLYKGIPAYYNDKE